MKLTPSSPEFDRVYGGDALKILQFYARDGEVAPAQKTILCYGVLNAKTIRMDPVVEGLHPSVNRCVEVSPAKTTSYTLIAEGAGGATVSQSVTVRVSPR